MAESICTRTHLCMRQADCPDSHCGGRWMAVQLHMRDGGHRVHFTDEEQPKPRRSFLPSTREAWGRVIGALLGLGGLVLFAQDAARHLFFHT